MEQTKKMTKGQVNEIIFNKLGFCGCGRPEVVLEFVHKALQLIQKRSDNHFNDETNAELLKHFHYENYEGDDLFYQMAWYFLDRGGLIEHGGSVGGSWLTDEGKEFLAYLDNNTPEDVLDGTEPYEETSQQI